VCLRTTFARPVVAIRVPEHACAGFPSGVLLTLLTDRFILVPRNRQNQPSGGKSPTNKQYRPQEVQMPGLVRKNLDSPDETRPFEGGTGELQLVDSERGPVGRATFHAGWRWSEHVKPIARTDSCQAAHVGYFVSGRMKVVMEDGEEMTLTAPARRERVRLAGIRRLRQTLNPRIRQGDATMHASATPCDSHGGRPRSETSGRAPPCPPFRVHVQCRRIRVRSR